MDVFEIASNIFEAQLKKVCENMDETLNPTNETTLRSVNQENSVNFVFNLRARKVQGLLEFLRMS